MKTDIHKLLNLTNFFQTRQLNGKSLTYSLKKPSIILMNNIYLNWLKFVHNKTQKHMPIFTKRKYFKDQQKLPYGYIITDLIKYNESYVLEHDNENLNPKCMSQLELHLVVAHQDIIQYFIQWQRYRKYWWSSITTTPSLFTLNDIKYSEDTTEANIVAQFPWGCSTVETISTHPDINLKTSTLKSTLSLENAMFILLLDGLNNTKQEYLRLHRSMAPYKIAFALQIEESSNKNELIELAKLIYYRLKTKNISSYIPDFTHPMEQQIRENLLLGVTYTAILCENTLTNGIFHLLNSSTMLKEEVHVADFDAYASLICRP